MSTKIIGFPYLEEGHQRCLRSVIDSLTKKGYKCEEYDAHEIRKYPDKTKQKIARHCMSISNYPHVYQLYREQLAKPIINLTHGMAIWKRLQNWHLADLNLLNHDWDVKHFTTNFPYYPLNYKVVGFPKMDSLVKEIPNRAAYKKRLIDAMGLDPSKPVVAFMPTWGGLNVSPEVPQGTLFELAKIKFENIPNFIIATHPSTLRGTLYKGKDLFKDESHLNRKSTIEESRSIYNRAKFTYCSPNKDKLLLAADIIVGDVSSIIIESLALDIPIIHLHRGSFGSFELHDTGGTHGLMLLGPVRGVERLAESIEEVYNRDDYKLLREYWRSRFLRYSLDGKATDRAVFEIENVIKEGLL